jgi:hypothetical protein
MKFAFVIVIGAALAAAACSVDPPSDRSKPKYNWVYEPEKGVVCDRIKEGCYDGDGPTMAATEKYLGPEAAQKFQKELSRVGPGDIQSIKFSDGVVCSYKSRLCQKAKFPDQVAPHHTKALFGEY